MPISVTALSITPVKSTRLQEVDTIALMRPITKEQILPRHPNEVPAAIERAFRTASEGRPGPVVIDLPMNVVYGVCGIGFAFMAWRSVQVALIHHRRGYSVLERIESTMDDR